MLALLTAIESQFTTAGAIKTAFPGGAFADRHPERQPGGPAILYPYASIQTPESPKQMYFGTGNSRSDTAVRFIVCADTDVAAGSAAELLEASLMNLVLTLSTGQMVNCVSMHDPRRMPLAKGVGENGADIWQWLVTLVYSVRN